MLITNFLHHFDASTNELLLRKVYAALGAEGRAVTLEFVPNEDRVSPPITAAFSMTMLGTTPSGDAYTFAEFDQMFGSAGFARSEMFTLPMPEQVIVSYKVFIRARRNSQHFRWDQITQLKSSHPTLDDAIALACGRTLARCMQAFLREN